MLVATPLQIERNKPRVISEIKKVTPKTSLDHLQPRISGELFFYNGSTWCRRHVQIRGGVLLVSADLYNGDIGFRVALRHLNLRPGREPRTFALYSRGCDVDPIATLQAATQREYDIWVKIISIELMRQTPLEAIKYLDIMGLAPSPSDSNLFNTTSSSITSTRSRRSSSSDRSSCSSSGSTDSIVTSPTLTQRRCRSELRLNLTNSFKEDMYKAKDLITTKCLGSSTSCDSSASSEEDFNKCIDCQNKRNAKKSLFQDEVDSAKNYFSYSDFQKQQARERIRRVLSQKQSTEKPQASAIILKKYDIGSSLGYSRVYNVREGIQLKSYDLKNIKPSADRVCSKKESTKLDMLRKNTNQLTEKKDLNFIITDYKSRGTKSFESIPIEEPKVQKESESANQSDEETVELLLQKCQNSDSYVPVKDKLVLFESLCRLGRRLAKSSEDLVNLPNNVTQHKRARSMHDLNTSCGVGVREICKYFEKRRGNKEDLNNNECVDLQSKYNTIAKGYRKVMRANKDNSFNLKNNMRKDYKSPYLYDQKNYYFGFKQFREGNRIISYV